MVSKGLIHLLSVYTAFLQMYNVFRRCKELGALPLVHAENGDVLEAVSHVTTLYI